MERQLFFKTSKTTTKAKTLKPTNNKEEIRNRNKKKVKPNLEHIPSIANAVVQTSLQSNFINVEINSQTVRTLVDSGSSLCCIKKSLYQQMYPEMTNIKPSKYSFVKGISGKLIEVGGSVDLKITIGGRTCSHAFHIIEDIHHSLIIGIDFLKQHKCTLNFAKSQFETESGDCLISFISPFKIGLARLTKSITIEPMSECLVPVRLSKIENGGVALVETVSSLSDKEVGLARTLVKSNNGRAICRILNPFPSTKHIKAGTVIGKLLPFDENSVSAPFCFDDVSVDDTDSVDDKYDDIGVYSSSPVNSNAILEELGISLEHSDISTEDKLKLKNFIAKNRDMFALDSSELGCTNYHTHRIETGDAPPQRQYPYRVGTDQKKEIETQVEDMLKNGIIEPSDSYWAAPVILCKKKDGTFRFAIDYRRLNAVTVPQNYPLPRFEDVVDSVSASHSKIFSVLDLKAGFHQIPLDPETKHKSTFTCHIGNYSFKRLPYGLRNAPVAFQKLMCTVLSGINFKFSLVYVDDIMVHSASVSQHLTHLQVVFDRLRIANLKLQPKKCRFATRSVEYLGHFFSSKGIEVNPRIIQSVVSFPIPKTQKQVQQFLGLCNYYRKFIHKFAEIAAPLYELTKLDKKFNWNDKCQEAFDRLKSKLTSTPILVLPQMDKPFIVSTDASDSAIGFILGQTDSQNRERVIAYGGRALHKHERNWPIYEKECLALVEAIKQFRPYLSASKFTVYTDNFGVKHFQKLKDISGRKGRWAMFLQEYDFEIIHKSGSKNANADALSRRDYLKENDQHITSSVPTNNTASKHLQAELVYDEPSLIGAMDIADDKDDFKALDLSQVFKGNLDLSKDQWDCPDIEPVLAYLVNNKLPTNAAESKKIIIMSEQYFVRDNVLYHIYDPSLKKYKKLSPAWAQVVVPRKHRSKVMSAYHEQHAHLGFEKSYLAIRSKYYWPKMYRDVEDHVTGCLECHKAKRSYGNATPPLHPIPVPPHSFYRIHLDIVGPLPPSTEKNYRYILVIVDSFSNWCESFPMQSQDATEVAKILFQEVICRYGAPRIIVTDRGSNFLSKLVSAVCERFQITRHHTSSFHPQSNSVVERVNGFLGQALRTLCMDNQSNWAELIPAIMLSFRNAVSSSTGFTPYQVLFGRHMNLPIDTTLIPKEDLPVNVKEFVDNLNEQLKLMNFIVHANRTGQQIKQKKYHDRNAKEPSYFKGQQVMLKKENIKIGQSRKLTAKFVGPYEIVELGPNYTYKLKHVHTGKMVKSLVNASRLKKFHSTYDRYADRVDTTGITNIRDQSGVHDMSVDGDEPAATDTPVQVEEVEKILRYAYQNGKRWYRVRFKGLDNSHNKLVLADYVPQEMRDAFHFKYTSKNKKRKTKVFTHRK